jgi:hypothetical protein
MLAIEAAATPSATIARSSAVEPITRALSRRPALRARRAVPVVSITGT